MISIVDYGMGNLGSVQNMLKRIGVKSEIISTETGVLKANKIILPGVGAFGKAMELIDALHLREAIVQKANQEKIPLLGICLGMQLLAHTSEENPGAKGLGLINADVKKFNLTDPTLKVPHMGWNVIEPALHSSLTADLPLPSKFYFVHSYHMVCSDEATILATTYHGGAFCSMVQKDNIFGAQFHPEKSHTFGMKLLENFSKI